MIYIGKKCKFELKSKLALILYSDNINLIVKRNILIKSLLMERILKVLLKFKTTS